MALLKVPEVGTAVTVTFPDPPEAIVMADGVDPKVRLELVVELPQQLEVICTGPEIWFVMLGLPTACTYRV
jgi:hypothetical protein